MGRAPCCEKVGLKKGPWTEDEDQVLINYIRLHGHSNWRALPKLAGLLRCGKSCRLRWTNYLRPDIKRGSFTPQEEDTIIHFHQLLGNKWSAIATNLPGRTDNEIKNIWHSHLKKRLSKLDTNSSTDGPILEPTRKRARKPKVTNVTFFKFKSQNVDNNNNNNDDNNNNNDDRSNKISRDTISLRPSSSEMSTITSSSTNASETNKKDNDNENLVDEINDDFWSEVLSIEDTAMSTEDLSQRVQYDQNILLDQLAIEPIFDQLSSKVNGDDVNFFWFNLLTRSNDHELPEIV